MAELLYGSTRGGETGVTASQAVLKGLANDGGLYVPERIPTLDMTMDELAGMTYQETAYAVMKQFLTDYTEEELKYCISHAYDEKFDTEEIAPLAKADGMYFLELFHGKTIAFKDMALSILPYLMTTAAKKNHAKNEIVILTATSGDTGKAAMAGFADVPGTRIIVFYPKNGVSRVQELQMLTQKGANTSVVGIQGNFDDAQSGVKAIFGNKELAKELDQAGYQFSSANSINIGRLFPQVVYYVWMWLSLLKQNSIGPKETFNVVVPTGNFGNILAAWIAKQFGTPIGELICASNENKVHADFFKTGTYDINRDFHPTEAPSMDILISSNFERFLYFMTGSKETVAADMQALKDTGIYSLSKEAMEKVTGEMKGGWASPKAMEEAMTNVYDKYDYLLDPHTAVAYAVYDEMKRKGEIPRHTHTVIVSTAHPYKFPGIVAKSLGLTPKDDPYDTLRMIAEKTGIAIPRQLGELESREKRFTEVVDRTEMAESIARYVDEIRK